MDRRGFLYAGGLTAAAASVAAGLHAAPIPGGRSVLDFGVGPDAERDQTAALQQAIDDLSKAGQAVFLPGGVYRAGRLTLPLACAIMGVPGMTVLRAQELASGAGSGDGGAITLFGLTFEGPARLSISNAAVHIASCRLSGPGQTGIRLTACSGAIEAVEVEGYSAAGIAVSGANASAMDGLSISACRFQLCGQGIAITGGRATVTQNHFDECGAGIAADGTLIVSGNIVTGAKAFGLKLGRAGGAGRILAQSNVLRDCRIGIGASSSGDEIMASLNFIGGAREGAVRAFDGDKLVGPDLARQSGEAYLNLMIAGNVAR